jgi:hypothetical protein
LDSELSAKNCYVQFIFKTKEGYGPKHLNEFHKRGAITMPLS